MRRLQAWWGEKRRAFSEYVEEELMRFVIGALLLGVSLAIGRSLDVVEPWFGETLTLSVADFAVASFGLLLLGSLILYLVLRPRLVRLRELAARDDLTQVYNSREFEDRIKREVARAQRYSHELSLVLLDLDGFKQVNEQWGYQTGDLVLQELAELLGSEVRESDEIFRYRFGDEFAILAPNTGGVGARNMAERLRGMIVSYQFQSATEGSPITLTMSAGVAELGADLDADQFQEAAEAALHTSKTHGNAVTFHP